VTHHDAHVLTVEHAERGVDHRLDGPSSVVRLVDHCQPKAEFVKVGHMGTKSRNLCGLVARVSSRAKSGQCLLHGHTQLNSDHPGGLMHLRMAAGARGAEQTGA